MGSTPIRHKNVCIYGMWAMGQTSQSFREEVPALQVLKGNCANAQWLFCTKTWKECLQLSWRTRHEPSNAPQTQSEPRKHNSGSQGRHGNCYRRNSKVCITFIWKKRCRVPKASVDEFVSHAWQLFRLPTESPGELYVACITRLACKNLPSV